VASSLAGAVPHLIEAVSNLRKKKDGDLNYTAWDLMRAGYASGLALFLTEVELGRTPGPEELKTFVASLVNRHDILTEQEAQTLTVDYLMSPLSIPVLRDAAKRIPEELKSFNAKAPPAVLRRQFEECLFRGLLAVRDKEPSAFQSLEAALSGPLSTAVERRSSRDKHYAHIIRGFTQQPIFGQEDSGITVSDLYVRQRCLWKYQERVSEHSGQAKGAANTGLYTFAVTNASHVKWRSEYRIADLHETVWAWLSERKPYDFVRVVAGGPGSGKSTFAKALAIEAIDRGEYNVLLVPLQEIESVGSFETRLSNLFKRHTDLGFDRVESPLEWMGRAESDGLPPRKPLLLVCDGLDEIAPPGSAEAANVTTDFIQALRNWLQSRNSGGCYAKAIVLGRDIAAEEAFKKLEIDWPCLLRVAGLLPIADIREEASGARIPVVDQNDLASKDQRADYWRKWCDSFGIADRALPIALKKSTRAAEALRELTAEPLLLYLLLWTGFLQRNWEDAASNRNVVYREIFRRIYQRDWGQPPQEERAPRIGEKGGHTGTKDLTSEDFVALQEALGLASWPSGGRIIPKDAFEPVLQSYLHADKLDDLRENAQASLKSVALQSYTRTIDAQHAGYEFVHKTMGEYLIGCALVTSMQVALSHLDTKVNDGRCMRAASHISRIAHSGPLTPEISKFFKDEVRLRFSEEGTARQFIQDKLVHLVNWLLKEGLPLGQVESLARANSLSSYTLAEVRILDIVWSFLQALAELAYKVDDFAKPPEQNGWHSGPITIKWPTVTSFSTLLTKLTDRGHAAETKRIPSFSFLNLEGQGLTDMSFGSVLFSSKGTVSRPSTWLPVSFLGCNLYRAEFYSSKLRRADLSFCNLKQARLRGADLRFASLSNSDLHEADLSDADLSHAELRGSKLTRCVLTGADLSEADLRHADLSRSSFNERHSRRRNQTFWPAKLIKCRLDGAQGKNINFRQSLIVKSSFTSADLSGSDLSNCTIEECKFVGANLEGAKLRAHTLLKLNLDQEQRAQITVLSDSEVLRDGTNAAQHDTDHEEPDWEENSDGAAMLDIDNG